jgi:hypothetical protein
MALKRLTPGEKSKLKGELESEEKGITSQIDSASLVIDVFQKKSKVEGPYSGKLVYGAPGEMEMIFDFTTGRGGASNIYHSFIYQAPKWKYTVKKVDDFMSVSPAYPEYYERTLSQREKLESLIKTGLASASQAVADYELMRHDYRRYKEIIDYFKTAKKSGDDHVLRSLFVDRIDAFTGEGYSMVTMARRWPTIITDFIRMKTELEDIDKIKADLDVSQAEATVLKTKNQLYKEWKEIFLPDLKSKIARIETMMNAREKSVNEYKEWLKPYLSKYTAMQDLGKKNPAEFVSNAYVTPGFGQSEAFLMTRLWVWKTFSPEEGRKPEMRLKARGGKWSIDPYDDIAKKWQRRIEYKYGVKFTEKDIDAILDEATTRPGSSDVQMMNPEDVYYILFDMTFLLSLLKTPPPEGFEGDNLMIAPIRTWMVSQNVLLLHLIEIKAREAAIEHYINEIIGAKVIEEHALERIEEEFLEKESEKQKRFLRLKAAKRKTGKGLTRFGHLFIKEGPYEPVFFERVSKMYFRATGAYYGQILGWFKKQMQVGK